MKKIKNKAGYTEVANLFPKSDTLISGCDQDQLFRFLAIASSAEKALRSVEDIVKSASPDRLPASEEILIYSRRLRETGRVFHESFRLEPAESKAFPEFFARISTIEQFFLGTSISLLAVLTAQHYDKAFTIRAVDYPCLVVGPFNGAMLAFKSILADCLIEQKNMNPQAELERSTCSH